MLEVLHYEEQVEDPTDEQGEAGAAIRCLVTSYGVDLSVEELVARMERKAIFVPASQRNFVWNVSQASRFVESLLLGLAVPGVFLFKDFESGRLMVVDGQQRLQTLQSFYKGLFNGRPFRLANVLPEYEGKTYDKLDHTDRRHLDNAIIHAAVFQQSKPTDDRSSIYSVFERLHTGGSPLRPQEIRATVYHGGLNDLLSELAVNEHWQQLYLASRERKKDEEIILRFLALYYSLGDYQRPMKKFLNDFMDRNREPGPDVIQGYRRRFEDTVAVVSRVLGPKALRPERSLNVSLVDAVFVGLARRLTAGPVRDENGLRPATRRIVNSLRERELHLVDTTDKDRVEKRIEIATREYGEVE